MLGVKSGVVVAVTALCELLFVGLCMCRKRRGVLGKASACNVLGDEGSLVGSMCVDRELPTRFRPVPLPNRNVSPQLYQ